ncbi:MAG: hypothetical protein JWO95_2753 [Verrucomicrobiales bacterium]|nr:hypothetical protein [Verrucomicrobiales bacterium]
MVKFRLTLTRRRDASRCIARRHVRTHMRSVNRTCLRNLPGFRRGPNDLSLALTAYNRAIRAHRRLARLAPEIFDATEVARLAHRRKQDAEWQALWEPVLTEVYGPSPPEKSTRSADQPQLPRCARTRQVIEREHAEWRFWIEAGRLAQERYEQRRPHALPTISQLAGLLDVAMHFGRLAIGSFNPASEPPTHAQALTDLKRAYGPEALAAQEAEQSNSPKPPPPPDGAGSEHR